ncbi:peptidoglycan -binding protein [Roseospira navarrensis]|uniref:Peptidoglycan-binding protein n=1 Tax=Roseospira navarrensis TaxID=140058 RepID=A0A7X1ZHG6_9PROT|nr:peptidoglycan -binding protein [Roseospira navarrensis]MQX37290.1 peptidoglycan -binding protein [Roseospira navarrensis]
MASQSRRRASQSLDIWPGFVDVLATLLIIVIFVLMVFVLAQFFMGQALSGRDAALDQLRDQIAEYEDQLALERRDNADLRANVVQLSQDLRDANARWESLVGTTRASEATEQELVDALALVDRQRARIGALQDDQRTLAERLSAALGDLNTRETELAAREDRIVRLQADLEARETALADRDATIESLRADLAVGAQSLEDLEDRRAALAAEVARLEDLNKALSADLEEAYGTIAADKETIAARKADLAALESEVAALEDSRAALREEIARLEALNETLSADLEDAYATIDADAETLETRLADLARLESQIADLEDARDQLREALEAANQTITADKETIETTLAEVVRLRQDVEALTALRDDLEGRIREMDTAMEATEGALEEEFRISEQARAQAALLNEQLKRVRAELARLGDVLEAQEAQNEAQRATIANLGQRLNAALASKVQELQRYRSEFFGRLRQVLGDREGIRIDGDRFVFQSEVLFDVGEATLGPEGRARMADLADTLLEIAEEVPDDIDWILRVDGHTDRRPINTARFRSNWELSASRAISVVQFLIDQGVPPDRLAAAGFGEFRPVAEGDTEQAYARNRRIELKLDQR